MPTFDYAPLRNEIQKILKIATNMNFFKYIH